MEGWQREALQRHRMDILNDLYVDYVVDHLLTKGVLLPEHIERIFVKPVRRDRAQHLLDLLPSLGPSAYPEFVASLRKPYQWLAEQLGQESGNMLHNSGMMTSVASTTNAFNKQYKLGMLSEEVCRLLTTLSSVASACGTSLCAVEDSLAVLVQTMTVVGDLSTENISVARRNSINASHGEQMERSVTRLKGGGDLDVQGPKENGSVPSDIKELEVSPEMNPSSEIRGETWKLNNVEGMMYDKDANIYSKQNFSSENTNEISEGFVLDPSDPISLPINSPDSGIIPEEMACLSMSSSNKINDCEEKPEKNKSMDMLPRKVNGHLDNSSGSSFVNSKSTPDPQHKELTTLFVEVDILRHSIMDIVEALKSVVQLSDKTLNIANSVSN